MSGIAGNRRVVVVDAGGANLGSVCYALERLGVQPQVVRDAAGLEGADRVILPGVGAAPEAMRRLREQGLVDPLRELQVPLPASGVSSPHNMRMVVVLPEPLGPRKP